MKDRLKFRCWDDIHREMIDLQEQDVNPYNISDIPQNNLMQCTGLKDKNGKLIYEGDILKCVAMGNLGELDDAEYFYNIIFDNSNASFKARGIKLINRGKTNYDLVSRSFEELEYFTDGIFEVIGNRFENPELLEEQCANQLNKG